MQRQVRKVAVLGSGVMGSAIAAHFANAGIPALVLDIVPPEGGGSDRSAVARAAVAALAKSRPSPVFSPSRLARIEVGNFEDDMARLAEADWVIEAVREDMAIKKSLLPKAAAHLSASAIFSTNTSGLSVNEMAGALPDAVRPRFLGTHFFNPPRYMRLLELVPTEHTDPAILSWVDDFGAERLGKGVVVAKDTPNFIANRIGVHCILSTFRVMEEMGLTVEEVDALTGPTLGRPKTATFRLADLVGLDTLLYTARTVREALPDDESRAVFEPPAFFKKMVERGALGRKSGAGFYRKEGKKILTLDPGSGAYRDPETPELPGLKEAAAAPRAIDRIRGTLALEGRAGEAAWKLLAPTLSYAAMRLGEIADDAETVDRALKLGFNWELGPFEIWDGLGVPATAERLSAGGFPLPAWIDELAKSGEGRLYRQQDEGVHSPTATPGSWVIVDKDEKELRFAARTGTREVRANPSARLVDLGDGILGLEFRSKMNALDADSMAMMHQAVDEAEARWEGLVVANDAANFCAGANLMLVVGAAREGQWDKIEQMIRTFQDANDRLERSAVPVVVAPHGMALGGGCEIVLAGNAVRASAESYVGLVEVGAGLIPGGGGCMRLYRRLVAEDHDVYVSLRRTFEAIGMAKVSTSAEEARDLGFLGRQDTWTMNRDHLTHDAKQVALGMARAGYVPPLADPAIPVAGRGGLAMLESGLVNMIEGRFISEHDRTVGRALAGILAGGDVAGPTTASESHLLDLERETFLRLCGEEKSQERMIALLKTGKPLRN